MATGEGSGGWGDTERALQLWPQPPVLLLQLQAEMEADCVLGQGVFAALAEGFH